MPGKNILYVILFGLTFVLVGLILVMLNPSCLFVIIGISPGYNCGDLSKTVFITGAIILIIGVILIVCILPLTNVKK
ncbi:MAG: hypothetical protein ACFE96_02210 [Candidatus Hermodarchaeota archaeon]